MANILWTKIAIQCHEANRVYCTLIGDNSQLPWAEAPEWQVNSALLGVEFHWNNDVPPEAGHNSWMEKKRIDGWVYGPEKDEKAKTHPCMVPFDQLPKEQRFKDHLFRNIVHAYKEVWKETITFINPEGEENVGN